MTRPTAPLRNISDTALWAALYRARETERPDALFHDPLARRLAGERGEAIAAAMPFGDRNTWSWVTRTWLYDQLIADQVRQGVDTVINLAAGLDARPYRMEFPASLRWIEIDLPGILADKKEVLRGEKPRCALEHIPLDLSDSSARRVVFERLGRESKKALIVAEGFLIYLSEQEVGSLSKDLSSVPTFQSWIVDMGSPGLVRMLQKKLGAQLAAGDMSFKFGPAEGPGFFVRYGWSPTDVRSLLKTAARLKRLSLGMRLLALLPASNGAQGSRPWGGVCLLSRT